jgi:hypothetical protein
MVTLKPLPLLVNPQATRILAGNGFPNLKVYLNPRSNKPGQWTNHDKPSFISLDLSKHQPTGKK